MDIDFGKYIENYRNEIISKTQELIQIPSVYSSSDDPKKPFGDNVNNALEYMLNLGNSLGFRTKNIDGYCGYIEFGSGDDLVGIIGHLDVVPEGDNWTFPPFLGKINNNCIYGRGAIDDKGPVISSLYAMKAVADNCKINKRVRLILGLNEENDWKCIEYYKEHEEEPSVGFSPDADFPCIYAEKSIISPFFEMPYSPSNDVITIKNIDCANNALNVVPKICSCVLKIDNSKIIMNDFIWCIKNLVKAYDFEIDIYKISDDEIKLTFHGASSHAAHPDLGVNAISRLLIILHDVFDNYNLSLELFDLFKKYIGLEYNGESLGIDLEDDLGKLTLNVGRFEFKNNFLRIGINLRVPVNTDLNFIKNIFLKVSEKYSNITCLFTGQKDALYIPKDDPLVISLCNIYNDVTGSNDEPIAIGGATYARAFKNCISFGANFPRNQDMCHMVDEFISIPDLILSSKIYARAIYELSSF